MGELSSSNHIAIACHCRDNPAGGPPSKARPAPATPWLSCRQRHSGAGCGASLRLSAGERGARPPTPTAPTLASAHRGARTPAHWDARTAHRGHRRALGGSEWGHSRIPRPRGRCRPPRPAPPLELASPGATPWAAKFAARGRQGSAPARARLSSTRLRIAVVAGPEAWMLGAQRCHREPIPIPQVGSSGLSESHRDTPAADEVHSQH